MPADEQIPQPTFEHRAYGVDLTSFGEEGGYAAQGHVPERRFLAACNHLARTSLGWGNAADDKSESAEGWLVYAAHVWALPEEPPHPDENEWWVRYDSSVTADTPGAIPMTIWEP
jgi:hypothetical protein